MCDLTSGRSRVCKKQNGGTKALFLGNWIDNPFTLTDGVVTGINSEITEVYKYTLEGDANTFGENNVGSRTNGTSVNTQTLSVQLLNVTATDKVELDNLVYGYPYGVIQDRNGVYRAIGIDDGIDFTIDTTTGAAKGDFNGYTLTGVSTVKGLAPVLDETTVTALLELVPTT